MERDPNLEAYEHKTGNDSQAEGYKTDALPGMDTFVDRRTIYDLLDNPFADFFWSIALLSGLIHIRDSFMPDIFHFLTCVEEDQVHLMFVMLVWGQYKCFLNVDQQSEKTSAEAKRFTKRL